MSRFGSSLLVLGIFGGVYYLGATDTGQNIVDNLPGNNVEQNLDYLNYRFLKNEPEDIRRFGSTVVNICSKLGEETMECNDATVLLDRAERKKDSDFIATAIGYSAIFLGFAIGVRSIK